VLVLFFLFLYLTINNNKEMLDLAKEKWQTENILKKNTQSLINSIKMIETEKALLETHFIKSSDIVPFFNTIEKLAKDVGVEAEVVGVDVPKDNSSLTVEMEVLGSFEMIYKLILLLENSQYNLEFVLVNIKNINKDMLSIDKNSDWTATFKIKLLSFVN